MQLARSGDHSRAMPGPQTMAKNFQKSQFCTFGIG